MRYFVHESVSSRSFQPGDPFLGGQTTADSAEVSIHCGASFRPDLTKAAILVELGEEVLAEHVNENDAAYANVLGFARYRNGDEPASNLVEIVKHINSSEAAIAATRLLFEAAGLQVVLCNDQAGRIINRLVIPKYNAAFRFLDEGLATQADMDLTCRLGLGYPDGPIERVVRGGLAHHYRISKSLHEAYGTPAYAPPRRASVAYNRGKQRN